MSELLKKINPKFVMGKKITAPEEKTELYKVFGIARSVKSGEGDYGPWTAFLGQFEVIRTIDQKSFSGIKLFLPEPMSTLMAEKLRMPEVSELQFAVSVNLVPSDTPIGYEYTCTPIIDADQADPLADLRNRMTALLPSPEAEKEPEASPEAGKEKGKGKGTGK